MEQLVLHNKTILITGAAGFIGTHLILRLLNEERDIRIVGVDNVNDYYDVTLKEHRLSEIEKAAAAATDNTWIFRKESIADKAAVDGIFAEFRPDVVVNLAAQAGVRYSIEHPEAYMEANITGFFNILEACRHSYDGLSPAARADGADDGTYRGVRHLVYASSSSVYGGNKKIPFSTEDSVDHPISLYAATKKSNELMAHCYGKLYDIPVTGLRFFTVYGPMGRPDMACFLFTNMWREGKKVQIFNYGDCERDFTYVDDIVEGVYRVMHKPPARGKDEFGLPSAPYAVYNIGNNHPEKLMDFVGILSEELIRAGVLPQDFDLEAMSEKTAMQPGDVPRTYADTAPLEQDFGYKPATNLRDGIRRFAEWYAAFYGKA